MSIINRQPIVAELAAAPRRRDASTMSGKPRISLNAIITDAHRNERTTL
jgi:hypothetical protein